MKLTLDLDQCGLSLMQFKDKAAWDKYAYDFRPSRGYYNPQPRDMHPMKFPCAMLYAWSNISYNSDRNDEFWNMFLYDEDYEIEPEQEPE